MPVVPRIGLPREQQAPLPSVRVSPDAPAAAFQPKPSRIDLTAITNIAQKVAEDEQKKADEVAEVRYTGQLASLQTNLLYGENGALRREGENAFTADVDVAQEYQKQTSAIEQGLVGERQKMAFRRQAMERWNSINSNVQQHIAGERQKYEQKEVQAMVDNEKDAAVASYNDPAAVQASVERQAAALNGYAKRHGFSEDQAHAMISKAVTDTHTAVIEAYTAAGQDLYAKDYYEKHKDQIAGADRPKIEQTLEEGSIRGESQRQTDQIVAKYPDEASALEAARQIKDPKIRDSVEDRVAQRFSEKRRLDRENENDLYVSAANMIDAKPGKSARDAILPSVWNSLRPTQRRSLEIYAKGGGASGGGGNGTDSNTSQSAWLDFLDLDTDAVKNLTRSELETRYLSKLGKQYASRAITRWTNARQGKDSGDNEKRQFTLKEDIDNSLRSANVIGTGKTITNGEKRTIAAVESEVQSLRDAHRLKTGSAPTEQDDRMIVDQVVMKHFFQEGGRALRVHNASPDALSATIRRSRFGGNLYVDYDEIPRPRRDALADRARRNGVTVDNSLIERAYAASLLGDVRQLRSLLGEKQ